MHQEPTIKDILQQIYCVHRSVWCNQQNKENFPEQLIENGCRYVVTYLAKRRRMILELNDEF